MVGLNKNLSYFPAIFREHLRYDEWDYIALLSVYENTSEHMSARYFLREKRRFYVPNSAVYKSEPKIKRRVPKLFHDAVTRGSGM
jgi:hypothetical protein